MNNFFANLFELWGSYRSQVSADLYDLNIYANSGFIITIFSIFMAVVFYFLLYRRQAKWDTLIHWIIWSVINTVLNVLIVGIFTSGTLSRNNIIATLPDYIDFLFVIFIWSLLWFFILSLIFKNYGHPSRSRLPF